MENQGLMLSDEFRPVAKLITLDWLELNFKVVAPVDGGGHSFFHLLKRDSDELKLTVGNDRVHITFAENIRTRVFSRAHEIRVNGVRWGTMFHTPYTDLIKDETDLTWKVDNAVLYSDFWEVFQNLVFALGFSLEGVKRIDIAADGFGFLAPMREVKLERVAVVGAPMINFTVLGGEGVKAFTIGSRRSDRYVRCYNKGLEIEQSSKKYYILDWWQQNGIAPECFDDVERLEVSMKGKTFHRMFPRVTMETLPEVFSAENMKAMFEATTRRLYEFREKTTGKITRAKKLFEIQWEVLGERKLRLSPLDCTKRIRSIQTAIKTNYQLFLKTGREVYRGIADEIVENTRHAVWFLKRKQKFDYEFELAQKYDRPFLPLFDDKGQYLLRADRGVNRWAT